MHRRFTRVPSFSRKRPAAPARANSHLEGSLGAGRRGGKGHELRGGGLMSGECWSIESETDPSSTSQSRKYHSAHLSGGGGGVTCSNIYSHLSLPCLIHAEAKLTLLLSLLGILRLILTVYITVSI